VCRSCTEALVVSASENLQTATFEALRFVLFWWDGADEDIRDGMRPLLRKLHKHIGKAALPAAVRLRHAKIMTRLEVAAQPQRTLH
jgi:hypothetical protein